MLIAILPLVVSSADAFAAVDAPRTAQVQLADALANADSIESVHGRGATFTFAITRGDRRVDLVATTDHGEVVSLAEHARGRYSVELGNLSWLADTMQETVAVTRLDVDSDGAVTLTTSEGMRYMAIPGRGSGGSDEAAAHWAGEFDRDRS